MRLRRIEIGQFRKLSGPVVLPGLGDGLIVVSGDNEEGKSTVLAALKAAFFEHHAAGGAVREAMAPHRGGVPEIKVEFDCAGELFRLRKVFRRAGVVLETPTERLQDDAAERRLQDLLRFERRQARSARPENAGLQALFWVDQATAFRDFESIAGGRDRLTAAIAAEIGTVAGGEDARRLLTVARERAAEFFTAGRQQETGNLKAATEQLRALGVEHAALAARRCEFDARVDRLARQRDERRRLIEQDQVGRAHERCETARRGLGELAELERRCALATEGLKSAGSDLARVEAQHRLRAELIADAARQVTGCRELAGRLEAAELELEVLRQAADSQVRAEADATEGAAAAERMAATARDGLAMARLQAEIERLGFALAHCRAAQGQLLRAQAAWASNAATPERLAFARACHQGCETASAREAVAATRLDFKPLAGRQVKAGGQAVDTTQPLRLARPTELELAGFGRLVVIPGGEDLDARQQEVKVAEAAFADALAAMNAPSLAEAEVALDRRREAESDLRRCEAEIKAVLQANAARSIDALAQSQADRNAELEAIRDRVGSISYWPDPAKLEELASAGAADLVQAQRTLEAARLAVVDARRRLATADSAAAGVRGEQAAAATRVAELQERLTVERGRQSDEALATAFLIAAEGRLAAEQAHDRLARELQVGDADGLRERSAIAERELATLQAERRRLDGEIHDLEVALREAGADSWLDRLGEIEGAVAAGGDVHRRLEREGKAWRLLADKLAAADQSVREMLVTPIGLRLQPLLQRVFPGAEPVLDPERLSLTHLRRDGAEEAFDSLSVGAREQLAVLVRLAFASLLAEREGEPPCLILDDALVYADERRFETMKAILQRAARDMQILVLTCRPRDYFGLDAHYLRLEDCRPA